MRDGSVLDERQDPLEMQTFVNKRMTNTECQGLLFLAFGPSLAKPLFHPYLKDLKL